MLEVFAHDIEIGERPQCIPKPAEVRLSTDSGEHLLPNRPDDLSPPFHDQLAELPHRCRLVGLAPAKCE